LKKHFLLFVLLLNICNVFAGVGDKYDDFLKSEFAEFFKISETGRSDAGSGQIRIIIKPGVFKEYIDISVLTDSTNNIISGELDVNRSWIDNPESNPFARDIVKSFIAELVNSKDKVDFGGVSDAIFNVKARQGYADVEYVFSNKSVQYVKSSGATNLKLRNEKNESGDILKVSVSFNNSETGKNVNENIFLSERQLSSYKLLLKERELNSDGGKKWWLSADDNNIINQVFDIRVVRNSETDARRYLSENLSAMSEDMIQTDNPDVLEMGSDARFFINDKDEMNINLIMYNYIFRVNNVIGKVFIAGAKDRLTQKKANTIALLAYYLTKSNN
jgi:hypothetical protein